MCTALLLHAAAYETQTLLLLIGVMMSASAELLPLESAKFAVNHDTSYTLFVGFQLLNV